MKFTPFCTSVLFFLLSYSLQAQFVEGGIKAGLNFPQQPKIDTENTTISDIQTQVKGQSSAFHLGLYSQFKLTGMYLRPELYYSHYKSDFLDAQGAEFTLDTNRLDVPVLIGFSPIDMVYVHGGLVSSFYFGDEVTIREIKNSEFEDLKFGYQIGSGLKLGKVSFEGRWEGSFSKREIDLVTDNSDYTIETNPSQFLISIGYMF